MAWHLLWRSSGAVCGSALHIGACMHDWLVGTDWLQLSLVGVEE